MFMVDKNEQLDLGKIIQQFQTQRLPILNKYYNYYKLIQFVKKTIARRQTNAGDCHVASLLAMTSWECCAKNHNYKI